MKPSEAFGVVVRGVGLVLLVYTANGLLIAVAQPALLFLAVPMLFIGLWLLRGAPAVVNFAYPNHNRPTESGSMYPDGFE